MRYIAFLRAINVGGRVVKMDRLRKLFETMGFTGVETFIASGNVIFDSPSTDAAALEAGIEDSLRRAFGYEVGVFLRTAGEVKAAAAHGPFDRADGCTVYVVFLKSRADKALTRKVLALQTGADEFHVRKREIYWMSRGSISKSPAAVPFAKAFGALGTMRNITTVRKLAAKYGG